MKTLLFSLLALAMVGTVAANGGPASTMKGGMQSCPTSNMSCANQGTQCGFGGPGMGRGRWAAADPSIAKGWQLMTIEERVNFQNEMQVVSTYDECKTVQAKHRAIMQERAKANNQSLMSPGRDMCAHMAPDAK